MTHLVGQLTSKLNRCLWVDVFAVTFGQAAVAGAVDTWHWDAWSLNAHNPASSVPLLSSVQRSVSVLVPVPDIRQATRCPNRLPSLQGNFITLKPLITITWNIYSTFQPISLNNIILVIYSQFTQSGVKLPKTSKVHIWYYEQINWFFCIYLYIRFFHFDLNRFSE